MGSDDRSAQRAAAAAKPATACDSTVQSCPLAHLIVAVKTSAGKPVESVEVIVLERPATNVTAADGRHDAGKVPPGTYHISARKPMHFTPASADTAEATVALATGETKEIELVLDATELHMHVDADRDGAVDDDRSGLGTWEWGAGKKGAIILCNNDGDGAPGASDNEDDKINGGNDASETAPVEFRLSGPKPPPDLKAFLKVSDNSFVRIFDKRAAGAVEIIGPSSKKSSYEFPNLSFTKREFGIEALRYADGNFSGTVQLTFEVQRAGSVIYTEQAEFRVAPWMMPNHLDAAETVYVIEWDVDYPGGRASNSRFRSELKTFVAAAGCAFVEHASTDPWMQDCMEFGSSMSPGAGFRTNAAAYRKRPLKSYPKTLRKADLGYHEQSPFSDPRDDTTFDSTGNLECTPPVTSKAGKRYPWGRIYFGPGRPGETMNPQVVDFLKKQTVQEPIEVDTSWLVVGHVDEFVAIVPGGAKGFKLLLASPKRAYKILDDARKAGDGGSKLLTGRKFPDADSAGYLVGWKDAEATISDFLATGIPKLGLAAAALKSFNDDQQTRIDATRTDLKKELGLDEADIIDVPVLFRPFDPEPALAEALTGDTVNMLVVNKHCIPPKPFGPLVAGKDLFEEELKNALKPLGLTINFLDDWYEYHVNLGEVHCGTNTLRKYAGVKWWEFTP